MTLLKIIFSIIALFWAVTLKLTFQHTIFWYAYLIVSILSLSLLAFLLFNKEVRLIKPKRKVTYHNIRKSHSKYAPIPVVPSPIKQTSVDENESINLPKHVTRLITNKHDSYQKEYFHTSIPTLESGPEQKALFEAIQKLKENHFFNSFYSGITNSDIHRDKKHYNGRKIYQLHEQILPYTYSKVLYDPKTDENRVALFMNQGSSQPEDCFLGFIAMEDSFKVNLLIKKYDNMHVYSTIIGGTYQLMTYTTETDLTIYKGFDPYSLAVTLTFFNNK